MKKFYIKITGWGMFLILFVLLSVADAQAQRLQQKLDRGVVAVYRSGGRSVTASGGTGYLISWRKLAQEPEGTTYNVYARSVGSSNFTKLNATPLKVTNYKPSSLANNTEYAVSAIVNGQEGAISKPFVYRTQPWPNVWLNIDFDNTVINRDDYRTKYVWPMDLDGDGEYDALLADRLYAGAASGEEDVENSATTSHKIQAYRFNGELLWTVDMGPNVNICGGQNDMVVAWDINCDGKCEVMIRASDGTRFWDKQNNTWGKYAMGSDVPDVDGDGIIDYRTQTKRNRPFYISVIDGETGAEIACNELKYEEVTDGSDSYNRTSRPNYMSDGYSAMDGHFCICYLDGIHPSLVMECLDRDNNKTHHNYVFTWDYDWTNGTPANWHHSATWSRNDKTPWPAEFHQLRVADVNGDGCDEMIQGGYSVNPYTGWFASPGIGHGDRFILSDIDPDRPGLEVYAIQQSALLGQLIYDARTTERIKEWYLPSVYDVGRGTCLDMDSRYKGLEILSYADDYVYTCKGENTGQTRSGSMYEGLWWDGDLQREWLNSPGGSGWGTNMMVSKVLGDRLAEFSSESDWAAHGGTGTRPAFMGDIIGDWREEVILAKQNDNSCTGLVGYTTAMPSDYSIYCLQQDPHYRGDCTTRGYYQHPNTGFYLGGDMPLPPLPPVFTAGANEVMYDISGDNTSPVSLTPALVKNTYYLMNPRGKDYVFNGDGTTGSGQLIKSMQGSVTFNANLGHTGLNLISEGTLCVNGIIAGPVELRARGTLMGNAVLQDTIIFEGALNYEGCRLKPIGTDGVMIFKKSVTLPGEVYIEMEAANNQCGRMVVEGDLTFKGTNYFTVNLATQDAATYVVAECTGRLTADIANLKTRGLEGINYDFKVDGKQLLLLINSTRAPATDVVWTGSESNVWNYKANNFDHSGTTTFVSGDAVVFNGNATNKTLIVDEMMVTNGVTFDAGNYVLNGDGGISGTGDVVVNKDANVTLNMKYSDYTGKTIVNGGMLTVPNFYDGGQKSALGAASPVKDNIQLNGGTLVLSKDNMGTDRQITITDTATIRITQSNSALSLKGAVSGTGYLIKDGAGQLNFTYGGSNNFAGVIVKKGIIAQGAWNATFGRSGSPMVLAGGEVHQIDVNSTSTVPTFNHVVTVEEGTTNKIVGSSRGKLNGSVKGKGNLTIETKYVRCDVGLSFSNFEGKLTAMGSGGNFRLMTNVTDMSKAELVLGAGTSMSYMASGGGSEATATLKIGTLSSTATDGKLSGTNSSYIAGYRNENSRFAGLITGKSFTKVGTGKLTLSTIGHTSPIQVNGGIVEMSNTSSSVMCAGAVTVNEGGTLMGNALLQNVTVNSGGVVMGGTAILQTSNLRMTNLTMKAGSTIKVQLGKTSGNSKLKVTGTISHNQDTLLIAIPESRKLQEGDELVVFTSDFTSATGSVIIKCEAADGSSYEFDSSTLNSDGKIHISRVATGIRQMPADDKIVEVYTVDGKILRHAVKFSMALKGLRPGVYIVGGMKMNKK